MLRAKTKCVVLVCVSSCLAGCKHHKEHISNARTPNKGSLFVEQKKTFMHLKPCDTLHVTFKYANHTGRKQLIDSVRTTCRCINVAYKHTPIMPNDTGKVKVSIDMEGSTGFFSKTIVVYFHDTCPTPLKVMGKIEVE